MLKYHRELSPALPRHRSLALVLQEPLAAQQEQALEEELVFQEEQVSPEEEDRQEENRSKKHREQQVRLASVQELRRK